MAYLPDSRVKTIVIHYSATPIEKDFSVGDIDRMHRRRGFNMIGYHYYVRLDGSVHTGRDMSKPGQFQQGAHCKGSNSRSIGVCFEGGVRQSAMNVGFDSRTSAQTAAMIKLIRELKVRYPNAVVTGHRNMPGAATQCPGFNAKAWWDAVEAEPVKKPGIIAALVKLFMSLIGEKK